ncbi:MAG: M23 family metallopeptidase [Betaproteobacteria bacterium]|nr:M23 family metallopeptidase [Betaproteobacteria bacterium]
MQLMWLAGPTGQVKSISITARNILIAALTVAMSLLLLGFALNWVGLKIAVEYNPDLARSLGGVTTEAEQQRMEGVYRQNLIQLQASLDQTVQDVKKLETLKDRFMALATPVTLKDRASTSSEAKGGPFVMPSFPHKMIGSLFRQPLGVELEQTVTQVKTVNDSLAKQQENWRQHLEWLEALPISMPIQSEFRFTSGFGLRNDPFTGALAMHEGIDFSAEVGSTVLAAASGRVVRSEWDHTFGNVIEIKHAENFLTRYAHLNQRSVAINAQVQGGAAIGEVGNTGRSTGPHLHYEIFQNGRVLNPLKVLPVKTP